MSAAKRTFYDLVRCQPDDPGMPDIGILRGACALMNQLRQQIQAQVPGDLVGRDLLDAAERHLRRRLRESLTGARETPRPLVVLRVQERIATATERDLEAALKRALEGTALQGAKVLILDSRADLEVQG